MLVRRIFLEGFRNYETAEAAFGENVNVITGQNAQGKTNLLEAIYYLTGANPSGPGSTGRSSALTGRQRSSGARSSPGSGSRPSRSAWSGDGKSRSRQTA